MSNYVKSLMLAISMTAIISSPESARSFTIEEPKTTGSFDIGKHNKKQISKLGFEVRQALSVLEGETLADEIKRLGLKTTDGVSVETHTVDKAHRLIIGTTSSQSNVTLNVVKETDQGTDLVISVRDQSGNFQALSHDQVGVFDFEGSHVGFEMEQFTQTARVRAYFVILIDRSGSMKSAMRSVKRAASEFLKTLPKNALCRVISFNTGLKNHTPNFEACAPNQHRLTNIWAKGGTNLERPLLVAYEALKHAPDDLKAVLVITDGVGRLNRKRVISSKTAPTHVLFMGDHQKDHLEDIADTFIFGKQDLRSVMDQYFKALSEAVKNQYVIHLPAQPKAKASKSN